MASGGPRQLGLRCTRKLARTLVCRDSVAEALGARMAVLKRRTRDVRTPTAETNGAGAALAVATFEYVEGEHIALLRLTGTWGGDGGHPAAMGLVVSRSSDAQ